MTDLLLQVDDVTVRYAPVTVLENVSVRVEREQLTVLIGPSGCGKSTLLRAIGGFIRPNAGQIRVGDRLVGAPGPDRMMVFQEFDQLLAWKTARENIAFALRSTRHIARAEAREVAEGVLKLMGLYDAGGKYPHQLSGGMQQRVAIARALVVRPQLLLMDEPFASLDALTRARLQDEVLRLARSEGLTIVFVTHSIAEAVFLGAQIVVLSASGHIARVYENNAQGHRDAQEAFELERDIRRQMELDNSEASHV